MNLICDECGFEFFIETQQKWFCPICGSRHLNSDDDSNLAGPLELSPNFADPQFDEVYHKCER